ncbi:MAG: RsmB/NOP family class I SAM-dependent RNA methyltransferase [Alphaproteobacteria bacterium]|nr:RsmB/NOP family class I SAM-dependent RNA methyltransferase [Alphaproteobacteria bacterium]
MTPGARLQSAIEILGLLASDRRPADRVLRAWFRANRYAGAKDRRTISRRIYTIIRSRARLDWWCSRHLGGEAISDRDRMIASLVLTDGLEEGAIAGLFDGGTYRPLPLTAAERTLITALCGHMIDSAEQPETVRGEYPDWLDESLHSAFDGAVVAELQALNRPAPLDIRVNSLKATREFVRADLQAVGIAAEPLPMSSFGLRIAEGTPIDHTPAFRNGLIEVQDEGSQLIAALTTAQPGMTVVDYCAGAGGKTLSLAATMEGRGRLVACDIEQRRLAAMMPRLQRAGIRGFVDVRPLGGAGRLTGLGDGADRVLADVPCSTSGAWRRDPAAKWRLSRGDLDLYVATQRAILSDAAACVGHGGQLVYATCSVLPEENENQAAWFLDSHADFVALPANDVWDGVVERSCPCGGPYVRLSPARTATDGYFIAIFERQGR